jgi:hypothetical protein
MRGHEPLGEGVSAFPAEARQFEWTNLAHDPRHLAVKSELAKSLPVKDHPDIGGRAGGGAAEKKANR